MSQQVVLITGCSRGIGLESAVQFARRGDRVVATMRDLGAADALQDALARAGVSPGAVDVVELDVTDRAACEAVVNSSLARHDRIDVLVNNAGIGYKGTLEELSEDDLHASLAVNFFGPVRLMKLVLPHMRERGSGRVINVSSVAGGFGQPFNDAYCAAKHALEGLCESVYPIERAFGVHVVVIEPGAVANEFNARGAGVTTSPAGSPFKEMRDNYNTMMAGVSGTAATSADIAEYIVAAATDPEPKPRIQAPESTMRLMGVKFKDLSGERVVGITQKWIRPAAT